MPNLDEIAADIRTIKVFISELSEAYSEMTVAMEAMTAFMKENLPQSADKTYSDEKFKFSVIDSGSGDHNDQ